MKRNNHTYQQNTDRQTKFIYIYMYVCIYIPSYIATYVHTFKSKPKKKKKKQKKTRMITITINSCKTLYEHVYKYYCMCVYV